MLYRAAIAGMLFATMSMVALQTQHAATQRAATGLRVLRESWPRGRPIVASLAATPREATLVADTSIVNVSAAAPDYEVPKLVKLALDEHVHSIDGVIVDEPFDAYRRILDAASRLGPEHPSIDIAVDSPNHERRILVILNSVSS